MTAPTDHPTPGSVLTDADVAAGWKLHDGGPNPVPGEMVDVIIRWRDRPSEGEVLSDLMRWGHARPGRGEGGDIIAYRLSRPQPEPVSGSAGEGVEAAVERLGVLASDAAQVEFDANGYLSAPYVDAIRTLLASHEAQAAEIKARGERIAALEEGLRLTKERIQSWPLDDQETCMCGSSIEGHDIGSGHSPVSQGDHAISMLAQEIDRTLTQGGTGQ